tara:strand:- start:71903 stop:73417 length:1515 start_codon:yes stop_codon:yes gene_type:complete
MTFTFYWDILPLLFGSFLNFWLGAYALTKGTESTARTFGWMSLALGFWCLCYSLSFMSSSLTDKIFWTSVKYIGATVGPALWVVLALQLTRQSRWLSWPIRILIGCWVIAILFIVSTNSLHQEFWQEFVIFPGVLEAKTTHGVLFRVYSLPMYVIILVSSVMYIDFYRRAPDHFQKRAMLFIMAGLIPVAADLLQQSGYKLLTQVDQVPLSLLISSMIFGLAIFRYRALEILPIARDIVVQNIYAGIVVTDVNGNVLEINPFALALTNHPEPLGAKIGDVYPGLDTVEIVDGLEQEIEIKTDKGERCLFLKVSAVVEDEIIGYVLVGLDITDRKLAERELELRATTDPLTGAYNRRAFFEKVELEKTRAKRQKEQLAVLMVDVDHFKKINDSQGHDAGDKVLIELVTRIKKTLRETDLFARYGGEEFICLVAGDKAGIMQSAERLRLVFDGKPIQAGEDEITITVSIGVALMEDFEESIELVIARADGALYHSKTSGRNRVSLA